MRLRRQWALDLALAATVIGLGVFIARQFQERSLQAQVPSSKLKLPPLPKGPVSYPAIPAQQPQGAPAIRPAKGNLSSEEVRQYLTSNAAPAGIKGMANTSISRADCGQTIGKVSETLPGKSLSLPSDMPVCYVELTGNFSWYTPPTPQAPRGNSLTFHTAFQVFDAKTGNLMVTGALNQPAGP